MQKSTLLVALVGLFLAVTLIWALPGYAQAQGGMCPRGYNQGAGPGSGGGPGYCPNYSNSQTCPQYGYGRKGRNRAQGNTPQAPANPNPQNQPQTQTPAPQSSN